MPRTHMPRLTSLCKQDILLFQDNSIYISRILTSQLMLKLRSSGHNIPLFLHMQSANHRNFYRF